MSEKKKQGRGVRYVTVDKDHDGQRLDNFLMGELGQVPRGLVYRLVRTGQVRVNRSRAKPMKKLRGGDEVRIPPVADTPPEARRVPDELVARIRQAIVYQDEDLVVIDKPSGVAVQGGSGLNWGLMDVLARIGEGYRPVHRLDRPTSGLLVVARNHRAARDLQRLFAGREVEKRYLALLEGHLPEASVTVDAPLKKVRDASGQHRTVVAEDGQPALTRFKLLETIGSYSYVEASIETGRMHQIRAHAADIGHPLAGDERYNQAPAPEGLKRLFLHAHYMRFELNGEHVFSAPLPQDLAAVLERLRGSASDSATPMDA